jgi:hypothetical protein
MRFGDLWERRSLSGPRCGSAIDGTSERGTRRLLTEPGVDVVWSSRHASSTRRRSTAGSHRSSRIAASIWSWWLSRIPGRTARPCALLRAISVRRMGSTIRRSSRPCEQAASLLARGSSWSPWRGSAPNPAPREQATRKGPREALFLTQRDTSSMAPVPREDPAFERPSMSTAPVPRESRRNPARVLSEDRAGTRVPSHAATGGPIGSWVPESKERAGDRPARIGY